MVVRCAYCTREYEYEDPKELDLLVCWAGGTAHVFCDADCFMSEVLFAADDEPE